MSRHRPSMKISKITEELNKFSEKNVKRVDSGDSFMLLQFFLVVIVTLHIIYLTRFYISYRVRSSSRSNQAYSGKYNHCLLGYKWRHFCKVCLLCKYLITVKHGISAQSNIFIDLKQSGKASIDQISHIRFFAMLPKIAICL